MRLLVLADIDDLDWRDGSGHADVLLSAGDVADSVILRAAEAFRCPTILAVKGNHDRATPFPSPILDLHLQVHEFGDLRFGGLNGSWRYKPRGHFLYDQAEVDSFLAAFPSVDIFLSHNSPRGIHDKEDEVHFGFEGLNAYVRRTKPKLLIHGHQHVDEETRLGQTRIVGVHGHSLLDV
jgi:Icc-related predicted phosphoesterase